MNSPDLVVSRERCGDVALPVSPFTSNRYHFGMLLGVADLEAEQAYHRGKQWMHNAWLHGPGCVWGLEVVLGTVTNELEVRSGLAIDAHGRELNVSAPMCVDLARWFAERAPDDLVVDDLGDGVSQFAVHVELCHDSCLDRPVPSISEPCDDSNRDTAYSRAIERGLPRIVAGPVDVETPDPYPRLRQFYGQVEAEDETVVEALAEIDAAADSDKPALCASHARRIAALDTMSLAPQPGALPWSPAAGDGCVPLANLDVHIRRDDGAITVLTEEPTPTVIDNLIRPSHIRTRTTQELLCHGTL